MRLIRFLRSAQEGIFLFPRNILPNFVLKISRFLVPIAPIFRFLFKFRAMFFS